MLQLWYVIKKDVFNERLYLIFTPFNNVNHIPPHVLFPQPQVFLFLISPLPPEDEKKIVFNITKLFLCRQDIYIILLCAHGEVYSIQYLTNSSWH